MQELGRRIREEEKRSGSLQFPLESRKSNVDRMPMVQNLINGKKTHEKVKETPELSKADGDKDKCMKNSEKLVLLIICRHIILHMLVFK